MDIAGDISVFDNYPAVVALDGGAPFDAFSGTVYETEAHPSYGVYRRFYCDFWLPSGQQPVIGSHITAGATAWTVLRLSRPVWNSEWHCVCCNLNLNQQLKDTITVYGPVFSTDAWADRKNTPTVISANVSCRIQPTLSGPVEIGGKIGLAQNFDIYIDAVLPDLPLDSYVTDLSGRKYIILSQIRRKMLDELEALQVQVQP